MENRICRHCKEPFAPVPGMNRRIDECPLCKPEPVVEPPVSATRIRSRPAGRPQYELPELKKRIKSYIQLMKPFKRISRKEAFSRWERAYGEGRPWAKKVLADLLDQKQDFSDL